MNKLFITALACLISVSVVGQEEYIPNYNNIYTTLDLRPEPWIDNNDAAKTKVTEIIQDQDDYVTAGIIKPWNSESNYLLYLSKYNNDNEKIWESFISIDEYIGTSPVANSIDIEIISLIKLSSSEWNEAGYCFSVHIPNSTLIIKSDLEGNVDWINSTSLSGNHRYFLFESPSTWS